MLPRGQGLTLAKLLRGHVDSALGDEAHLRVAFNTATKAVAWMADRFAGKPPPDECVKGTPQGSIRRCFTP